MTAIYSQLNISGLEVKDAREYLVNKVISEGNSSSSFLAYVDNHAGRNGSRFTVGEETIVYANTTSPPGSKIFVGILEDIEFEGEDRERIVLTGRDYSLRLMDRTVEPEVYTNLEAGSIVKDIVAKYTNNIGQPQFFDGNMVGISSDTGSVAGTDVTIPRISFSHTPVYDAVRQLAELSNQVFYVDEDKVLHFTKKSTKSSGHTFDSGNVWKANFREQRDTVFNQIWVYGDRYLDGYQQTFTADGGSVFTLLYNPSSTEVTVSGALIQPGAIKQMTTAPGSEVKYLVSYDDKQIIFLSGTNQGLNVPASGNSVVIAYKRNLPIVKVGDNEVSKQKYGTRIKVILNKDIKDPQTAEDIRDKELELNGDPKKEGTLSVEGIVHVMPGETCVVNLPWENMASQTCDILEARYVFNRENNLSGKVLEVVVNNKLLDLTDTIKKIMMDLKKLQTGDINVSDFITRYQYATGSMTFRQSGAVVYTLDINDSFIAGHPDNSIAGTTLLGDRRGAATAVWSGGYFT